MGLLDQLSNLGGQGGISAALEQLLQHSGGGLNGLVNQFNQAGLGNIVNQWIGTGPNPGINASQLEQVFGAGTLATMAAKLGLPLDQLTGGLAQHLPAIVDHATPAGTIPAEDPLAGSSLGGILGSFLGGR